MARLTRLTCNSLVSIFTHFITVAGMLHAIWNSNITATLELEHHTLYIAPDLIAGLYC